MTEDPVIDPSTSAPAPPNTWIEVDRKALHHNVAVLRRASQRAGGDPILCVMVKGNAYGHGLIEAARVFLEAGCHWLAVHDLEEARALRAAGLAAPIYVVGYLSPAQAQEAVRLDARFVLYDADVLTAAAEEALRLGKVARVHVKIETGNNRQGLRHDAALALCRQVAATPGALLEGLATHFADVEDTTDHRFALSQLQRLRQTGDAVTAELAPAEPLLIHAANSAALLLWPDVVGRMARFGIAAYGLWPSKETWLSACQLGQTPVDLRPGLTWKTVVAQVRDVPAGEYVGYGRTWRAVRATRVAVLPVGYYDGYDRGNSNLGKVLIGGVRAPVIGRVAMNMTMVDVTDHPEAHAGSEVVLLGAQRTADGHDGDHITAEEMASWSGTIHYEVVTRINERIQRLVVG